MTQARRVRGHVMRTRTRQLADALRADFEVEASLEYLAAS